jgi:hypothetical protein
MVPDFDPVGRIRLACIDPNGGDSLSLEELMQNVELGR